MQKIIHPIELEKVDRNSFRRLFWPLGTHTSLLRILNNPIDARSKSNFKSEHPLLGERLMKYCEVRNRIVEKTIQFHRKDRIPYVQLSDG